MLSFYLLYILTYVVLCLSEDLKTKRNFKVYDSGKPDKFFFPPNRWCVNSIFSEMHFETKQKTMKYAGDKIKFELLGNFKPVVMLESFLRVYLLSFVRIEEGRCCSHFGVSSGTIHSNDFNCSNLRTIFVPQITSKSLLLLLLLLLQLLLLLLIIIIMPLKCGCDAYHDSRSYIWKKMVDLNIQIYIYIYINFFFKNIFSKIFEFRHLMYLFYFFTFYFL